MQRPQGGAAPPPTFPAARLGTVDPAHRASVGTIASLLRTETGTLATNLGGIGLSLVPELGYTVDVTFPSLETMAGAVNTVRGRKPPYPLDGSILSPSVADSPSILPYPLAPSHPLAGPKYHACINNLYATDLRFPPKPQLTSAGSTADGASRPSPPSYPSYAPSASGTAGTESTSGAEAARGAAIGPESEVEQLRKEKEEAERKLAALEKEKADEAEEDKQAQIQAAQTADRTQKQENGLRAHLEKVIGELDEVQKLPEPVKERWVTKYINQVVASEKKRADFLQSKLAPPPVIWTNKLIEGAKPYFDRVGEIEMRGPDVPSPPALGGNSPAQLSPRRATPIPKRAREHAHESSERPIKTTRHVARPYTGEVRHVPTYPRIDRVYRLCNLQLSKEDDLRDPETVRWVVTQVCDLPGLPADIHDQIMFVSFSNSWRGNGWHVDVDINFDWAVARDMFFALCAHNDWIREIIASSNAAITRRGLARYPIGLSEPEIEETQTQTQTQSHPAAPAPRTIVPQAAALGPQSTVPPPPHGSDGRGSRDRVRTPARGDDGAERRSHGSRTTSRSRTAGRADGDDAAARGGGGPPVEQRDRGPGPGQDGPVEPDTAPDAARRREDKAGRECVRSAYAARSALAGVAGQDSERDRRTRNDGMSVEGAKSSERRASSPRTSTVRDAQPGRDVQPERDAAQPERDAASQRGEGTETPEAPQPRALQAARRRSHSREARYAPNYTREEEKERGRKRDRERERARAEGRGEGWREEKGEGREGRVDRRGGDDLYAGQGGQSSRGFDDDKWAPQERRRGREPSTSRSRGYKDTRWRR